MSSAAKPAALSIVFFRFSFCVLGVRSIHVRVYDFSFFCFCFLLCVLFYCFRCSFHFIMRARCAACRCGDGSAAAECRCSGSRHLWRCQLLISSCAEKGANGERPRSPREAPSWCALRDLNTSLSPAPKPSSKAKLTILAPYTRVATGERVRGVHALIIAVSPAHLRWFASGLKNLKNHLSSPKPHTNRPKRRTLTPCGDVTLGSRFSACAYYTFCGLSFLRAVKRSKAMCQNVEN